MKKLISLLLSLVLLSGCASSFYQITPEDYRARVKRLGVLPVLVDEQSTILHPQKDAVLGLLRKSATGREARLVEQLDATGGYEVVKALPVAPPATVARLFKNATLQVHKGTTYRQYQPDAAAFAELARAHGVDGILVVVLNGINGQEKRWERSGVRYLESQFNTIQATAMVVGAKGELLWVRPGYVAGPFLDLQYIAFDEARHNRTDEVKVHFLSVEGLERTLQAADKTLFGQNAFPSVYRQLFDALSDSLRVGRNWLAQYSAATGRSGEAK